MATLSNTDHRRDGREHLVLQERLAVLGEGQLPGVSDDIGTHGDSEHVAHQLAARLAGMNPFDATQTAVTAALSSTTIVRRVIAEALAVSFNLVGDDFVLDELARDPDIGVRSAALRARVVRGLALAETRAPPHPDHDGCS